MSDLIPIFFHCRFQLLLWHRKRIAETWGRDCPPNSGAADRDKWVIGDGNMLICYCTIHHNLSIWSFILHCCTVYWCSSNLKLLTLILWDGFICGAKLPSIVLVGMNSGCLMLPVRLAKSEKSGILNKNVEDITDLDLGTLPKYTEGLQQGCTLPTLALGNHTGICKPEQLSHRSRFYKTSSA